MNPKPTPAIIPTPTNKKPHPISNPLYSQIPSRLFSSLSPSRKPTPSSSFLPPSQTLPKTIRRSIQKVQQLGEQKYKEAMRHMDRLRKLQEDLKRRRELDKEKVDQECTFKPKVNKNKKYSELESRFMNTSYTVVNRKKKMGENEQKDEVFDSQEKDLFQSKEKTTKIPNTKKPNNQPQLADRLMQWSHKRDTKIITKTIENEFSKSLSRGSSIQSQSEHQSTTERKQQPKRKIDGMSLKLTNMLGTNHQVNRHSVIGGKNTQVNPEIPSTYHNHPTTSLTPRTQRLHIKSQMGRSMMSSLSNNNTANDQPLYIMDSVESLDFDRIDQTPNPTYPPSHHHQTPATMKKQQPQRLRMYTQIHPSLTSSIHSSSIGEQILSRQGNKAEGEFYLRQAKANIIKHYQKANNSQAELVVKNDRYMRNFVRQNERDL